MDVPSEFHEKVDTSEQKIRYASRAAVHATSDSGFVGSVQLRKTSAHNHYLPKKKRAMRS
jgi:hypothetical protein